MANTKEYKREKAGSKIAKIVVDRDLCIGAASCVAVSGVTFELDEENKAVVTSADTAEDDELIAAAESCPTKAILLYDKDGQLIFPK
jgi:ferredoxin